MAKTTIQLSQSTKDELEDLKRVDGESFESVVQMLIAKHDSDTDDTRGGVSVDSAEIAEQLKDEISMANEPGVEVDTQSIINRIDDLEAQLPRKVVEELQG